MPSPLPSTQPSHIWTKTDTYVRLLFIDFSSAFNTIIPQQLIHKLVQLGLNTSLCNWLWTFWPGDLRQYGSAVTHPAPSHWTQGPPKDVCWAPSSSPCWPTTAHRHTTPTASLNLRMDTTVVGLISNRDETNYRSEVSRLAGWCSDNNLSLNVEKTKEIVVDFRRVHTSMLLWPSMVRPWREWAAPSSWVYTSQRTSPGPTTLQH